MEELIVTYQPDNSLRKGYLSIFKEICQEIYQNRWLTLQLFKRDFSATYKQSLMGFLWAFIIPILSIGTFVILNRSGIFKMGTIDVPYPIFAVISMAFWQLFSAGLVAASQVLVIAGPMITKINFSKKSLVIASIGQAMVSFLIQMLLLIGLFFYFHMMPHIQAVFILIVIIPIILLTLGLGFILSLINSVMRDVSNILPMFLTFFMFLTPILYTKPQTGLLMKITEYNPLYYFVLTARDLFLKGQITEPVGFLLSSLAALLIFIVCLFFFHLTENRITEIL